MARLRRAAAPKFCERYQMRCPSSRKTASPVRMPTSTARRDGTLKRLGATVAEVALFPDRVCLAQPRDKRVVDVGWLRETKVMDVIACGDRLDLSETRVLETAGEDDVAVEPLPSRRHLREGHAHLEGNARFFRGARRQARWR